MKNYIISEFTKTREVFEKILADEKLHKNIEAVSSACIKALRNGKKIMFCGNGGSAADSQHLAAELVSKLSYDRPALNAMALSVDTSALTAIGNDYGYLYSFSRQVDAVGQEGDVLIGISTSGRSKNVVEAMKSAKAKKIVTVGLLGLEGRDIGEIADYQINIPSSETPKIQEGHIATGHIICALIEDEFFGATHNPHRK
ncbi:MAG: D-sedoheptulose 7-phosphate isomerase [Alphaproteobacteria bacterium]|nr:D-sedoheptulose 7-phosphate isomerase [Alphaproteobacteria bacterium]